MCGGRWGWCGFPVVFLCVSGDSEGRVLVFSCGVCGCLCFCAEGVIFGRGVTLGVTERGYTFGGERGYKTRCWRGVVDGWKCAFFGELDIGKWVFGCKF